MRYSILDDLPGGSEEYILSVIEKERNTRASWQDFLGRVHWDICGTLTFRVKHRTPEPCFEIFRKFLRTWETEEAILKEIARYERYPRKKIVGNWANARKKNRANSMPFWFVAAEPHEAGGLHLHFLLKPSPVLSVMDEAIGKRIWRAQWGNEYKIETLRSQSAGIRYASKNIMTEGDCSFSENFPT
jgi:hypothetical protein